MPFGQFNRDSFRTREKHQLSIVKVHHLVSQDHAPVDQPPDFSVQVRDREADMIEAGLCEILDVRFRQLLRLEIPQELDLEPGFLRRHQRDVFRLDLRHAHVAGKSIAGNHHGLVLDEPQKTKKSFGLGEVPYYYRHVVNVQNHGSPLSNTTCARVETPVGYCAQAHVSTHSQECGLLNGE
ncbi:protein of unknown function [Nitrospira japonica]|uniref:Uncharacterized protein n=1 Tax=Nitrospira japonica TaxID=1325564 RepID=A0A1W1IAQ6_9BACT|nr:protein of unknown function [Nitrospira japonica]